MENAQALAPSELEAINEMVQFVRGSVTAAECCSKCACSISTGILPGVSTSIVLRSNIQTPIYE